MAGVYNKYNTSINTFDLQASKWDGLIEKDTIFFLLKAILTQISEADNRIK